LVEYQKAVKLALTVLLGALLTGCSTVMLHRAPNFPDLAYASLSEAETLDLYLPQGAGPFPLLINIHGGGFLNGDKSWVDRYLALTLLANGYAIASLDYRLSGEATFPAALQDVKAAVRFLRLNASRYRLDPERFAVLGQSAGGNLAAMLGVTGGIPAFDDPALGSPGVSSRVQAVIVWFGPIDFASMDKQARTQGCSKTNQQNGEAWSYVSKYLGAPLAQVPQLVKQSSPLSYITQDDPPFLVQQGNEDCIVPIAQSELLVQALKSGGVDVQYTLLQGIGHGDSGLPPVFQSPKNLRRILQFLQIKLRTTNPPD
jgi:acetyl esterase/lipase